MFVCSRIDYCNSYSLASRKFDYLLSRPCSVLLLNSLLVFHVSLTFPLLRLINFIGFPSLPALNLKFYSMFSSLNSVLLPNAFLITSDYVSFLRYSNCHDLFIPCASATLVQTRAFTSIGPFLWNCLPPLLHPSILSLRLYVVLSLTFFLKHTESASVWLMP